MIQLAEMQKKLLAQPDVAATEDLDFGGVTDRVDDVVAVADDLLGEDLGEFGEECRIGGQGERVARGAAGREDGRGRTLHPKVDRWVGLPEPIVNRQPRALVVDDEGSIEVLTEPGEFERVRDAMRKAGFRPESAQLTMRASTNSELDVNDASSMVKLLETLEDLDDVQEVYSNADISDDVLAQL